MAPLSPEPATLTTERLILRPWRDADRSPFAHLNADPEVMRHFPASLPRVESDRLLARIQDLIEQQGYGLWAVEAPGVAPFIGFIGLGAPLFDAHFTPCIEVGWRLARAHWGRGYATEGALASVAHGFEVLGLDEIVAFTVPGNLASRRVMEKIGMRHDPADDFDHPRMPAGHPLRRHVLYRLPRSSR